MTTNITHILHVEDMEPIQSMVSQLVANAIGGSAEVHKALQLEHVAQRVNEVFDKKGNFSAVVLDANFPRGNNPAISLYLDGIMERSEFRELIKKESIGWALTVFVLQQIFKDRNKMEEFNRLQWYLNSDKDNDASLSALKAVGITDEPDTPWSRIKTNGNNKVSTDKILNFLKDNKRAA